MTDIQVADPLTERIVEMLETRMSAAYQSLCIASAELMVLEYNAMRELRERNG